MNSGSFDCRELLLGDVGVGHRARRSACGPPLRSVCSGGALPGIAAPRVDHGLAAGSFSGASGLTSFSTAFDGSGAASVLSAMSLAACVLALARPCPATSALTASAFPDSPKLSASSRFLGALAAIACFTAAMKPALSKPPGLAPAMVSAWAAFAWASLSAAGGTAASAAFLASTAGGGCFFSARVPARELAGEGEEPRILLRRDVGRLDGPARTAGGTPPTAALPAVRCSALQASTACAAHRPPSGGRDAVDAAARWTGAARRCSRRSTWAAQSPRAGSSSSASSRCTAGTDASCAAWTVFLLRCLLALDDCRRRPRRADVWRRRRTAGRLRHHPFRVRGGLALEAVGRVADRHAAARRGAVDGAAALLDDVGQLVREQWSGPPRSRGRTRPRWKTMFEPTV